jgi:SpoVK/Ycf46/Vps4 family AAA+-type ATPase
MLALRERLEARPISMNYFLRALNTIKPSLSKEIVDRYVKLYEDLKRMII